MLIAGRTGVGKSTLINAVFNGDMATTGQGRPVTRDIREITKDGIPLTIFDTRGLAVGNGEQDRGAAARTRPVMELKPQEKVVVFTTFLGSVDTLRDAIAEVLAWEQDLIGRERVCLGQDASPG